MSALGQKRTCAVHEPMSALGQKRTCATQKVMSALPPKADMCGATRDVCFVPIADMAASPGPVRASRSSQAAPRRKRLKFGTVEAWHVRLHLEADLRLKIR